MYVEVAAHVLINAHGIIRRVAHEAQAARLGLVRELGTDHFARASQHDAGSERLVHAAQQQHVGQGDQVAREHGQSSGRPTVQWMAEAYTLPSRARLSCERRCEWHGIDEPIQTRAVYGV